MSTKNQDSLQQFTALRSALVSEREALQKRLHQIESVLGGGVVTTTVSPAPVVKRRGRPPGKSKQVETTLPSPATPMKEPAKPVKKKRKMSAEGRASIVAAQKARWAKIKAEKPKK